MGLVGRWVHFAVRDIYFPSRESVLDDLHGNDVLSGQIIEVTDGGAEPAAFLVIKVDALKYPVVVAAKLVRD
jgi:hypothetical protein